MIREIAALRAEIEALKSAMGRLFDVGTVEEVDAEKGYRLKIGERDGQPVLSPWYPHPESGKTSIPLKKGQTAIGINPGGDARQGFLLRGGYSDGHQTPNRDMEANVFSDADVTATVKGGAASVTAAQKVGITTPDTTIDGKAHVTGDTRVDGRFHADGGITSNGEVHLGGDGGKRVARLGDRVHVMTGSSAGLWPIVEASTVVFAVD